MAILRLTLLALLPFLVVKITAAPIPGGPEREVVKRFARESLANCDITKAAFIAGLLDRPAPDLATAYRLAWIARVRSLGEGKVSGTGSVTGDHQLRWKASPEIWSDEWTSFQSSAACNPADPALFADGDDQKVIDSLLSNYRGKTEIAPHLVDSVTTNEFNHWRRGEAHRALTPAAGCQAEAREIAVSSQIDLRAAKQWNQSCNDCPDRFCAAARLRLADEATRAGNYDEPLAAYVRVSHDLAQTLPTVEYRVAALQILTGKPLATILRTATPLFSDESTEIPALQAESVRGHVCSALAEKSPGALYGVMTAVFPRKELVRQLRTWVLACPAAVSERLYRITSLGKVTKAERESLQSALRLRKHKDQREARAAKEIVAAPAKGGVVPSAKLLPGALAVPMLLPLPEVKWPAAPYYFERAFGAGYEKA